MKILLFKTPEHIHKMKGGQVYTKSVSDHVLHYKDHSLTDMGVYGTQTTEMSDGSKEKNVDLLGIIRHGKYRLGFGGKTGEYISPNNLRSILLKMQHIKVLEENYEAMLKEAKEKVKKFKSPFPDCQIYVPLPVIPIYSEETTPSTENIGGLMFNFIKNVKGEWIHQEERI